MTWTYTNKPSTSARDEVRFLVGDTDNDDQLATDEEIAYAISTEANSLFAASRISHAIGAMFSRDSDKEVGDLRLSLSQRSKQYKNLSDDLKERGKVSGGTTGVYAGGLSIAEKITDIQDTDLTQPKFTRKKHEHPGASQVNLLEDSQ